MSLRLNTLIRVPDGRVGTICYHNLDGDGGVWGEHSFTMPASGFGPELPTPDFMLRDPSLEPMFRREFGNPDLECVGERFQYVEDDPDDQRGAQHDTRAFDCWCEPSYFTPCPECGDPAYTGAARVDHVPPSQPANLLGCWRCVRGLILLSRGEARACGSLVVVHDERAPLPAPQRVEAGNNE